jgi:adenosylcobinamide-GDP ribazoletransferase
VKGLLGAVGFLTRVPVRAEGPPGRSAVPWFPIVGACIGAFAGGLYATAYQVLPSPLAALIAVTAAVFLTGALHEDVFADTADAFGSGLRGEQGLEIMRDSRLGTFGSIAIVVSISWRVLSVSALGPAQAFVALVMAHTLGRTAAVVLMTTTKSARDDGLGRAGVLASSAPGIWAAVVSGVVLAGALGGWWVLPALALASLGVVWLRTASLVRFSGVTGDILGAGEQITEIAVLTVVAAVTWAGSDVWWLG